MVAVPIEIIPAFSTKHAPNFDVVANAFWGTDAEGPVHQAHVVTTVEHLYERELRR